MTVGGQEMYLSALLKSACDQLRQLAVWGAVLYSAFGCHICYRGYESGPDDIIEVNIITQKPFLTAVGIDYCGK